MSKENTVLILWNECKEVFRSADNKQLKELLKRLLEIVKKNYNLLGVGNNIRSTSWLCNSF